MDHDRRDALDAHHIGAASACLARRRALVAPHPWPSKVKPFPRRERRGSVVHVVATLFVTESVASRACCSCRRGGCLKSASSTALLAHFPVEVVEHTQLVSVRIGDPELTQVP